MKDLLLHDHTRASIEDLIRGDMHAILLVGELGAGKSHVARSIVAEMLATPMDKLGAKIFTLQSDGKAIGIESVRQVQQFLQLKTPGTEKIRRAVIIEDAEAMTTEAQNALLKVLEEPPLDTVIVLTTAQQPLLRPTILSRTQLLLIKPVSGEHSMAYFSKLGHSEADIKKAHVLANGQVGLMHSLLSGKDHILVSQIDEAKKLFGSSVYDRLLQVEALSKDKDNISGLVYACKRIAISALEGAANRDSKQVHAWLQRLKSITFAEEQLLRSPNTKLLLTDLFISL